jgi:hypothetical protein
MSVNGKTALVLAGSGNLGAAALATAGPGHYRSTTQDGQPVSSCYPLRMRFALTQSLCDAVLCLPQVRSGHYASLVQRMNPLGFMREHRASAL